MKGVLTMKLKKNQKIKLNDKTMTILDFLGAGGQGEVYLVSYNRKQYALKIYLNPPGYDFRFNLKNNIDRKSPSEAFLWPLEMVNIDEKTFGYLMDLRPSNYESFIAFLNGRVAFKDNNTLISWCIELCNAFKKLHEKGFSYQDLNDGSFFLDPETGALLICDNDNVTADKKNLGVLGKMKYMAPEIVRADKNPRTGEQQMPDIHSDRFSLAVILFMALCLGNPFEGEKLKQFDFIDENAEMELYGTKPIFIYHKEDKTNRPIRGYHSSVLKRWPYLPIYIKEAFHKTFVDGLVDRENQRTTELEWIKLLSKYRDELITCGCGYQYPYGFDEKMLYTNCPRCNKETRNVSVLSVGRNKIILEPNKNLYQNHLDKYSAEYNKKVAVVITNKNNPNLWGIKLDINEDIKIVDAFNAEKVIKKDGVIPIIKNLKIEFPEEVAGKIE